MENYIELIKKTKGEAIKNIPDKDKTSLICRLAVEYNKELIKHVPNKYLTEVLSGKEFIDELKRRKEEIIRCEANFLFPFPNPNPKEKNIKDKYIEEGLNEFSKRFEKAIAKIYNVSPEEMNDNKPKKR